MSNFKKGNTNANINISANNSTTVTKNTKVIINILHYLLISAIGISLLGFAAFTYYGINETRRIEIDRKYELAKIYHEKYQQLNKSRKLRALKLRKARNARKNKHAQTMVSGFGS